MTLITKQKVQQLIYILKQENSRSLFLSCLPGDFKRTRTKLDLARLDDFQPGYSERLLAAFKSGGSVNYSPTEIDLDSALDQAVVTKKLSALFDQGRVQEKEKGSNPLKIGFPILVQENRSASSNCYAAPLFIWDIDLKPGQNTWSIQASKDAPSKNYSLEGLVEGDSTSIDLSALYERFTDGQQLNDFMEEFPAAIQQFLEDNPNVKSSFAPSFDASLEAIPFTKKSDLVTDEAQPYRLSLINGALMGKFAEGKISIIRDLATNEEGLENLADGKILTASLGANRLDPSQASAIIDINKGEHLVLHGPPGTGKSQSITALVTAAVAQNLRVAVVCQKMAALEVIENNLNDLGVNTGIAKITNPIKDRRSIIDQARDRAETSQSCGSLQVNAIVEKEYRSLSKQINNSKKAAQQILIEPGQNFKDSVARMMHLERQIAPATKTAFIQKSPSSAQLEVWSVNKDRTTQQVKLLQEQFHEVKPILHLSEYFNSKVATAQVGNDLVTLSELRKQLNETNEAQDIKRKEILDRAHRTRTEEEEQRDWLQAKTEGIKSTLASLPRELSASELPIALIIQDETDDKPLASIHTLVSQSFDRIVELEDRKFTLSRNPECDAMRNASNVARSLKRLFNKKARSFWADWTALEHDVLNSGLNISDDLTTMREALKKARTSISETKEEQREGLPKWETLSLSTEIKTRENRIETLTRILDSPDSSERLEGAEEKYTELETLTQQSQNLADQFNGFQWLTSQGAEAIKSDNGDHILSQLRADATALPLVSQWLLEAAEWQLNPSDFEFENCLVWVEYQTIRHIIRNWSDMDVLLMRDSKINQIEKEVRKLRNIVNQSCINAICKQFKKGVTRIERHPTVHSFRQEFAKTGRNRKSLRKLYHKHSHELTQLFPIHLTTPEVICNLFEGRDECFDLLIFDEASQVELQDSATCLLKGTSIVVAGDEHQMPPSQYFKGSSEHLYEEDNDDEYTGADIEVESLLEFCQQQPQFNSRFLDFHYRSHHPSLIQFSNHAIYSRLVIRPTTLTYKPIQLLDVQGTWENQHNLDEIDEIIRTLGGIVVPDEKPPKVMIATFNVRQRTEIIRAIEESKEDQEFRDHIAPLEEAGLNVKNLENLQGDECDILIISIGYGRTPSGKFVRNYSLINRKNGYRLLNVLITRARYKVIVLNSIPREVHSQYEQELTAGTQERWSRGLLHAYIQYAQSVSNGDEDRTNRILQIIKSNSLRGNDQIQAADEAFESPFEEEVWNVLREQYEPTEITLQQPAMGFRIDMVVTPQSHPGLKIAIECDGEAFHSGWQNQLADFHREKLLRGAGYEFVRIWSRNWWMDTPGSGRQLFNEIDQIKANWAIKEVALPDWITKEIEFETSTESPVIIEPEAEVLPSTLDKSGNSKAPEPEAQRPAVILNHVLAPCLVTAKLMQGEEETTEIRYLFLSDRINSFRGHTRDQWQELGRLSQKMATFGEEHEVYQAFQGKEVGDTVNFRSNQFKVVDLGFDD